MAWLSEISPGTKINVEDIKGTDLVRMGIQFETLDGYTNDFLPIILRSLEKGENEIRGYGVMVYKVK
jgi:hypothetical protein